MRDQSFLLLFCILMHFSVGQVSNGMCNNSSEQTIFKLTYELLNDTKEPDVNDLKLFIKSRSFTKVFNITDPADTVWDMYNVEPDQRLIIFLHGFTDDPSEDISTHIVTSFLDKNDTTIIELDASSLMGWLYFRSSVYVPFIGYKLAEILAAIVQQGQDPSLIHIIGHSVAAHIAGYAGRYVILFTTNAVGRITGLDPACVAYPGLWLKLTDADYVDVIHTDAEIFGMKEPVGHKDYYPNSGTEQPNCILQTCSQFRSLLLFGESLDNPEAFPAVRCKDWDAFKNGQCDSEISYMGYPSKPGEDGLYFLQTGGTYPFGLGMEGIKYKMNS